MSKVDWSLAPDDAQIYSPEFGTCKSAWYKVDAGKVFCWPADCREWSEGDEMIGELIYRPKQEPKPWSGPEDGFPLVGTECEVREVKMLPVNAFEDWSMCNVVAHNTGSSGDPQVCTIDDRGDFAIFYPATNGTEFRAIRTPEQLAAEKRETAIREIMDIAQVDCRVTAARLVYAGFKRVVV